MSGSRQERSPTGSRIQVCSAPSAPFRIHPRRRLSPDRAGRRVRRRRECEGCGDRFTTYERVEGRPSPCSSATEAREPFDRQKLLRGLAARRRQAPGTSAQLEALADSIALAFGAPARRWSRARSASSPSAGSPARPRRGDPFASVYRNLADLDELDAEVRRFRAEPLAGADQLALDEACEDRPFRPTRGSSIGRSPLRPTAETAEIEEKTCQTRRRRHRTEHRRSRCTASAVARRFTEAGHASLRQRRVGDPRRPDRQPGEPGLRAARRRVPRRPGRRTRRTSSPRSTSAGRSARPSASARSSR